MNHDEGQLHNRIKDLCRTFGWIALGGRMDRRTRRQKGEPDFIILAGRGRTLLVECKSSKGKLSTDQWGFAKWADGLGHKVHVVRSVEEFADIINQAAKTI